MGKENLASKSTDFTQAFNFTVSIDAPQFGLSLDIGFDKVSNLRESTGQVEWRSSGDIQRTIRKLQGLTKTEPVTLDKVYTLQSDDLAAIRKLHRAAQGRGLTPSPYFTAVITPHANLNGDVRGNQIKLRNAWVSGTSLNDFDVNSTELSTFSIELSYDTIYYDGEDE